MRRRWIRNEPSRRDNALAALAAAGVAAGVAAVTFYLARVFLSREEIEPLEVARRGETAPEREERRRGTGDASGKRG